MGSPDPEKERERLGRERREWEGKTTFWDEGVFEDFHRNVQEASR